MKKLILFFMAASFTCLSFAQTRNFKLVKAQTENSISKKLKAVVIGMSNYGGNKILSTTLNDATDMANVLTQLGFEVTVLKNTDLSNLKTNLTTWYNSIERNDIAIFYFAGHGVEVNGENYLIPLETDLSSQTNVQSSALNINQILNDMDERHVGIKLLILDVCRNNPFKRNRNRGNEVKNLAGITTPTGTYIAFASAPGNMAQDGINYNLRNGVFTHFLKQEILKEGLSIDEIFNNVINSVSNFTNKQQIPFKNSSLTENFYFNPPKTNTATIEVTKKYYYYVDQHGNESHIRFDDRKIAENEMKSKKLYGKIYSNTAEVFEVEKTVDSVKSVPIHDNKCHIAEPEMVFVHGGTFTMGCISEHGGDCYEWEKPVHQVTVSDFYIGKYEVTQEQWQAVMDNNPSYFKGDNLPVENVNWNDVQNFICKLNVLTGKNYRLPTEAEWEYACRGGLKSSRHKYSGSNNIDNVAWYSDNSGDKTHAVGTKLPNELGIYDMSGNVWELCSDWYGSYSRNAQTNPTGAANGSRRVLRGGSWDINAKNCRVSYRVGSLPDFRYSINGFRLVLVP